MITTLSVPNLDLADWNYFCVMPNNPVQECSQSLHRLSLLGSIIILIIHPFDTGNDMVVRPPIFL